MPSISLFKGPWHSLSLIPLFSKYLLNETGYPAFTDGSIEYYATGKDLFEAMLEMDSTKGMFCGHDHEPRDHARAHLCYDRQRRELKVRSVEMLNSGSFLNYGGYGARAGYRPKSDKMYKLVLHADRNRQKVVETVGFYLWGLSLNVGFFLLPHMPHFGGAFYLENWSALFVWKIIYHTHAFYQNLGGVKG